MRVQKLFFILLLSSLIMACSQKTKNESSNTEVKEVVLEDVAMTDIADEVPPPPPDLKSNFKTIQDWLFAVCADRKPEKSITNYEFGLFESPSENIMFLIGVNKYEKNDTSWTVTGFEPSDMYFPLPKEEYSNLNRDELLSKMMDQLKGFTNTEKFKTSFLTNADSIVLTTTGQTIWKKL